MLPPLQRALNYVLLFFEPVIVGPCSVSSASMNDCTFIFKVKKKLYCHEKRMVGNLGS